MKLYLVLALLVLLAGCTTSGGRTNTNNKNQTIDESSTGISSKELSIDMKDFPSTLSYGDTKYFNIITEAKKAVQDVRVQVYNLGSYLESSCSGITPIRNVAEGEKKEVSCSLKVTDQPLEDLSQEVFYEATYKVNRYTSQTSFKVYDHDEFDRENPAHESKSVDLDIGTLSLTNINVEEGQKVGLRLSLDGELATGDCGCNIERAVIKLPKGFTINGFSGWTQYTCGNFNCLEKRNIKTPLDAEADIAISGIIKTNTFYVGAEISGVWKLARGSNTIDVVK